MMKSYEEVFGGPKRDLGPDYELREVKTWRVHCRHCGVTRVSEVPQSDKSFAALQRLLTDRHRCRNPNCVSNGGNERRRNV